MFFACNYFLIFVSVITCGNRQVCLRMSVLYIFFCDALYEAFVNFSSMLHYTCVIYHIRIIIPMFELIVTDSGSNLKTT